MQDCVLPVLKVKIVRWEKLKLRPNDRNISAQQSQNCWPNICKLRPNDRNIHWKSDEKFDQFQIWANNTQHFATCHNRVANRTKCYDRFTGA